MFLCGKNIACTVNERLNEYLKKLPERIFGLFFKWAHLGSNQGPSDYESDALTG